MKNTTTEHKQKYLYELENDFKGIMKTTERKQQHNFNLTMLGLKDLGYIGFSLNWFLNLLREDNQQITQPKRNKLNLFIENCGLFNRMKENNYIKEYGVLRLNKYGIMDKHHLRLRGKKIVYTFKENGFN